MASPTIQQTVEMASLPEPLNHAEESPGMPHHEREDMPANDSHEGQSAEPGADLAGMNYTEEPQSEPGEVPSEVSSQLAEAQEDTIVEPDVSTGHLKTPKEGIAPQPALVGSRTREMAFEWVCHVTALAVTLYLVSLSFTGYYWVDENEWDRTWYFAHLTRENALKALQFAAKAHETIIIMSLLAIVLQLMRRRLTTSKGLSLGHLVSGYQVESIGILFRQRLWSPVFHQPLRDLGALVVTAVLLISVVLSKFVGPASAILALPSLQWWPVVDPFVGYTPWASYNCTEQEMYPMDLSTKHILDIWSTDYSCTLSNMSMWCPGAGWDELNVWSGSNAFKSTPENLTMTTSYGRYKRTLSSAYLANTWPLEDNYTITAEAAATLHNGVTDAYGSLWDDMNDGYATLTRPIERPYLSIPQPVKGVATQVRCTSFSKSQLSLNQSLHSEKLGFVRPIPASIWNATGLESTSTVKVTWIDMGDTAKSNKSIGVLVTLPQAFQSQSGMNPTTDPTLRQDYAICLCAVVARWAPVNMGWDANMTNIVSSNLTKGDLVKLGEIWHNDSHASEYGASRPIHIGVDWADMLNVDGRVVEAYSGQVISAPSIEALFWRHMSQYSPTGNGVSVWSMNSSTSSDQVQVQADNKKWAGFAVESLAARFLSLVFTDGLSRAADWAEYSMFNSSQPRTGYCISVDVKRYGWGYGLSGLTIFAICVLSIHAGIVVVYTGYSVYADVRGGTERTGCWPMWENWWSCLSVRGPFRSRALAKTPHGLSLCA
ncbi:hypothetical protein PG997_001599 [Apiospora hydei]|uniref:Uncharacterized protein n=1 Tax=Apiospora hydei TaxID=1337664 RepID=A0ABR1XE17_9PEZI